MHFPQKISGTGTEVMFESYLGEAETKFVSLEGGVIKFHMHTINRPDKLRLTSAIPGLRVKDFHPTFIASHVPAKV